MSEGKVINYLIEQLDALKEEVKAHSGELSALKNKKHTTVDVAVNDEAANKALKLVNDLSKKVSDLEELGVVSSKTGAAENSKLRAGTSALEFANLEAMKVVSAEINKLRKLSVSANELSKRITAIEKTDCPRVLTVGDVKSEIYSTVTESFVTKLYRGAK